MIINGKKYYSIGEFARLASVSSKTIRFYQQEGILKPSYIKENGYRYYEDEDIIKLQKIVALRYIGLPIKEIKEVLREERSDQILNSLELQKQLIQQKILNLQGVIRKIESISEEIQDKDEVDWEQIIKLMKILSMDEDLVQQYRDSSNIVSRINLHKNYSTAKEGWFQWMFSFLKMDSKKAVLEVGCGNGELWYVNGDRIDKDCKVILSDNSIGIVNDVRNRLGKIMNASYEVIDCCDIPYADDSFDLVIANHMLFYVSDIGQALSEIRRVLKPGGCLICSTYGKHHMKEIEHMVKKYDSRISLSEIELYELFGIENGEEILGNYFDEIKLFMHEDSLKVDNFEPLYDYIMSCHGNQKKYIVGKEDKFKRFLRSELERENEFIIHKEAGVFICR